MNVKGYVYKYVLSFDSWLNQTPSSSESVAQGDCDTNCKLWCKHSILCRESITFKQKWLLHTLIIHVFGWFSCMLSQIICTHRVLAHDAMNTILMGLMCLLPSETLLRCIRVQGTWVDRKKNHWYFALRNTIWPEKYWLKWCHVEMHIRFVPKA